MSLAHRPYSALDATDCWIIEATEAFFVADDPGIGPCRFGLLLLGERLVALPTEGLDEEQQEDQRHNALAAMLSDYLPHHQS